MFFNTRKFKRNYVSEIDQFLQELNNLPGARSNSRIETEHKHQRIFALRDNAHLALNEEMQWKNF
ncbi:MAG TPA: CBU_0585 family protein [Gammaproteobacteria bacterium]|nr:CBU_0585 family protein [Gammaproteobacteria bacterium]